MSGDEGFSRRGVLAASGALAGGLIASPAMAIAPASSAPREGRLVVYNAGEGAAVAVAVAAQRRGIATKAMVGDRIWFARPLFDAKSGWAHVLGIGDHVDFLLLARHGQEAGFRLTARFEHRPAPSLGHSAFPASLGAERIFAQAGRDWPALLVDCVFGGGFPEARGDPCQQDGQLYSWVLTRHL